MQAAPTIPGLRIEPPLVNGSGVVDVVSVDDAWNLPAGALRKLGAFTTKTITRAARAGHPQPWADTLDDGSLLNAAGLPNPGIDAAARDWAHLPELLGMPIIASIGGSVDDLPHLAAALDRAGWAAAIELNLSCPNVDGGLVAGDEHATAAAVASVRAVTSLPLLAKLTPACGSPRAVARAAVAAGADALTCGNTMPARAVDPATGAPLLGAGPDGGLSGRALHPIALRLVAEVAAAVDVPIVGLGGVDGLAGADRMLDAGATIVGVGTGAALDHDLLAALAAHLASRARVTAT